MVTGTSRVEAFRLVCAARRHLGKAVAHFLDQASWPMKQKGLKFQCLSMMSIYYFYFISGACLSRMYIFRALL